MGSKYTDKVIKHAIVSSLTGDTIGMFLDNTTNQDKFSYFKENIKPIKTNKDISDLLVKTTQLGIQQSESINSIVFIKSMELFASSKSFTDFNIRLKHFLNEYDYYDFKPQLLFSLGFFCGFVSAKNSVSFTDCINLSKQVFKTAKLNDDNIECFMSLSFLVWVLCDEGYFGEINIDQLITQNLISGKLGIAIAYMVKFRKNKKYITQKTVNAEILIDLTYEERTLVQVLFYLFQIDSGLTEIAKPRYLIDDIIKYNQHGSFLSDILFLFGGLTTASEHHYLLFTLPLQKLTSYNENVNNLFKKVVQ